MTPEVRLHDRTEVHTAGIRRTVPLSALTDFFSEAFTKTMSALDEQGVAPIGPPFGKYYGSPGATVDVEAGFPVAAPIDRAGEVAPGSLPRGRVLEAEHLGPYDELQRTYAVLQQRFVDDGLIPGDVMWESYLSDPGTDPDPAHWRTLVSWPVADRSAPRSPATTGESADAPDRRPPTD